MVFQLHMVMASSAALLPVALNKVVWLWPYQLYQLLWPLVTPLHVVHVVSIHVAYTVHAVEFVIIYMLVHK